MANTFTCRLITPEAKILEEKAVSAVLPAWDGQIGILPGRAPIVMRLGIGELRLEFANQGTGSVKGGARSFLLDQGFANMVGDQLTILADKAIPAESLSETDCQAELAEAEARRTDGVSIEEADKIRKVRDRARQKLRIAREFKARSGGI